MDETINTTVMAATARTAMIEARTFVSSLPIPTIDPITQTMTEVATVTTEINKVRLFQGFFQMLFRGSLGVTIQFKWEKETCCRYANEVSIRSSLLGC